MSMIKKHRSRYANNRGLVFKRLFEQAVVPAPVTEKDVTCGYDWKQ